MSNIVGMLRTSLIIQSWQYQAPVPQQKGGQGRGAAREKVLPGKGCDQGVAVARAKV